MTGAAQFPGFRASFSGFVDKPTSRNRVKPKDKALRRRSGNVSAPPTAKETRPITAANVSRPKTAASVSRPKTAPTWRFSRSTLNEKGPVRQGYENLSNRSESSDYSEKGTTSKDSKPASKKGLFHSIWNGIRGKFTSKREKKASIPTLEQICGMLGRLEDLVVENQDTAFESEELQVKIALLGGQNFNLVLPPVSTPDALQSKDPLSDWEEEPFDAFIAMLPAECKDISTKASPLGLVPKLLPYGIVSKESRYVGSCFWMWLCIVDDITEDMVGPTWDEIEHDLFVVFANDYHGSRLKNPKSNPIRVSVALKKIIMGTHIVSRVENPAREWPWRKAFLKAVREIIQGFKEERPLIGKKKFAMEEWMRLRMITISVRPFLILCRADLGLDPIVSDLGNPLLSNYQNLISDNPGNQMDPLTKLEILIQIILGLENDILGWEKDFKSNNELSAIQVEISHGVSMSEAVGHVIEVHNDLVKAAIEFAQVAFSSANDKLKASAIHDVLRPALKRANSETSGLGVFRGLGRRNSLVARSFLPYDTIQVREASFAKMNKDVVIRQYIQLILGLANGMAVWMAESKRYKVSA